MRLRLGRRPTPRVVTLYTRAGCGLCRRAEAIVTKEARDHHVRCVDIDADPVVQLAYNIRVPVIEVDGMEIAEGGLTPGVLRDALRER